MSFLTLDKFGDNLPVTGIVALSQAAIGFGIGLLVAEKLSDTIRQRTALALVGAGIATVVPFIAGVVSNVSNRPDSTHRLRQRLAGIRRAGGFSEEEGAY